MKDGQELGALVARAQALDEEITKANAVSAFQQQALEQLVADIEAYNAATGRFDISVARAVAITPSSGDPAQQALQSYGGQPIYFSRHTDPGVGCKECTAGRADVCLGGRDIDFMAARRAFDVDGHSIRIPASTPRLGSIRLGACARHYEGDNCHD